MHPKHCGKQHDAAVSILDVGPVNEGVKQQSQRIYEYVALLALDFLARIIAMRIDPGPPFSALFTLWLSMTAAVGLASRSLCSRQRVMNAIQCAFPAPQVEIVEPERGSTVTIALAKLAPPDECQFSLSAVGVGDWRIDGVEPAPQLGELLAQEGSGRDVLIYVHGYNQTFEMAALDAARLSDGVRFRGETMMFSWPSKAKLIDCGYDRESAMWSRDALERVLDDVMASPGIGRVHIVAHSIGTMLTMEALRQLSARHADVAAEKIGSVVFAAPDIDMDVFKSSVERIGPIASKITLVTATNDRALAVSGMLAGGISRVGAAEKAQLEGFGLQVIDASESGWGIINHDLFVSNAQVRQVIRNVIEGRPGMGA